MYTYLWSWVYKRNRVNAWSNSCPDCKNYEGIGEYFLGSIEQFEMGDISTWTVLKRFHHEKRLAWNNPWRDSCLHDLYNTCKGWVSKIENDYPVSFLHSYFFHFSAGIILKHVKDKWKQLPYKNETERYSQFSILNLCNTYMNENIKSIASLYCDRCYWK